MSLRILRDGWLNLDRIRALMPFCAGFVTVSL